ncbi:hypothetical protein EVAR_19901_1 [Eumeta japonica]|uniref:Uncharacterized protein n=1 Tax=Eumeta variegata TaxID=151549 RepID=A0A4C1XQK0_EUMVA|nr:hypothetical protein EVAR_19901_1 [Eumeta japonica]
MCEHFGLENSTKLQERLESRSLCQFCSRSRSCYRRQFWFIVRLDPGPASATAVLLPIVILLGHGYPLCDAPAATEEYRICPGRGRSVRAERVRPKTNTSTLSTRILAQLTNRFTFRTHTPSYENERHYSNKKKTGQVHVGPRAVWSSVVVHHSITNLNEAVATMHLLIKFIVLRLITSENGPTPDEC